MSTIKYRASGITKWEVYKCKLCLYKILHINFISSTPVSAKTVVFENEFAGYR